MRKFALRILAIGSLVTTAPVDVAVLVPATFEEVAWHPEAIVANLRPRRILLGHWEDFFQPVGGESEPVPLSDLPEFERRLGRVFGGEVIRPEPFTEITVPASDGSSRLRPGGA